MSAERRRKIKLVLARLALVWERLWLALWPLTAVSGVFLAVALLDLLPRLGGWLHFAVLAAFAAVAIVALWRGLKRVRLPDAAAARRRIETASGLPHRPLETLDDDLAAGRHDPAAEALWQAHRRRIMRGIARLRVGWPAPGLPRTDRYALRGALALVLLVAIAAGWREPLLRMSRALSPELGATAALRAGLDIWITPPDYTGLPPVFLQSGATVVSQSAARADVTGLISVPVGSVLLARLHGGSGTPVLRLGGQALAFTRMDAATHHVTTALALSGPVTVEQDGELIGRWRLEVVPDAPPTVAFATAPARTGHAALRLAYVAEDDYGLAGVRAVITRVADAKPADLAAAIELKLTLPGRGLTVAKSVSYHDLTAHVWAGLPVDIRLEATDGADQKGVSERFRTVLPERIFNHPVARAIVEQRKQLTLDPEANAVAVAEVLEDLAARPRHFFDDMVVFLGLTTASSRLLNDAGQAAVEAVQRLLWDTALHIEDGKLSIAGRELRRAQQQLMEALANDALDPEIDRLMDQLQAALDEYLQALAEELARQQQSGALRQPIDPQAVMMDRLELQRMIEQARELARSGAKAAAQQMLSQLQEMLEALRSGTLAEIDPRSRAAWQSMQDLQDLIDRQHRLLDETFRRGQQLPRRGQAGPPSPGTGDPGEFDPDAQALAGQRALRGDLGDLVRRLDELTGGIPRGFGRADRAMRDAVEALRRGLPGDAVAPQTDALDQLRQAERALLEQMQQQMGAQGLVAGPRGQRRRRGRGRDPFGRSTQDGFNLNTSDVRIPDQADLQRARDILDELRRRAGDRQRPVLELDYFDRLLRRF